MNARKFVTIQPVLDPNRERLQEGPQAVAGSKAPGKGSVEQLYHAQVETIRKLAAYACRRYGFGREEVEDFTQHVLAKIWDEGCAVLQKFQGRSNLASYLAVVVQRALQDYVNSRWGKWRPSKAAQRRGQLAIDLETLLVRDRLGFDEACRTLRSRGATATDAELDEIAARLPPRPPRRIDGSYDGAGGSGDIRGAGTPGRREPVAAESADDRIRASERQQRWQHAMQALAAALAALPAEDRLIAKMVGEFGVVDIAAHLGLEQKPLYKRKEKILARLREVLESAGVSAADVAEILGDADS
ncbi:MAG TPA: sigma-70 family RNA polymerase sigma factor [Thermoanaerobaculia bacterium]|nr:sigma-70 family RNA polymerase sigma factor [Thermoanaerobaculia bacterium]